MSHLKVAREGHEERGAEGALAVGTHEANTSRSSGSDSGTYEAAELLNDLGVVHHTRCQIQLAAQRYQEALSTDPGFRGAQINLGAAHYHRGDVESAIEEWEEAVAADSGLVQTYHNLGIAYKTQERLGLATEAWESALLIDPNHADAYFGLGETRETLGEPETALENYRRFVDLAPVSGDFYVSLARERIRLLVEKIEAGTGDRQMTLSPGGVGLPLVLA